ncbi:septation protein SepH [Kribbella sp. NPDC004875]|uniref:septation protein SepH n=1 Tax=Kribbella sp. NPDC004875 TaxID=3364107 RepID=UPI0036CE3229
MREARLVGLSQDGTQLILAMAETGEEFAVPVDDRLRAALRGDRARLGQLEIQMESALRPRDIQARIRAGESPEAVAAVAQMPMERVMAFAGPVLAERDHIASLAQRASVRRRGGGDAPTRNLGAWVTDRLRLRHVDPASADWDAWRREDGRWAVRVSYFVESEDEAETKDEKIAMFAYDAPGRYAVPDDDEARWLVGEQVQVMPAPVQPQPGERRLAAVVDIDPLIAPDHGADSYEAGFEDTVGLRRRNHPVSRDGREYGLESRDGVRDEGAREAREFSREGSREAREFPRESAREFSRDGSREFPGEGSREAREGARQDREFPREVGRPAERGPRRVHSVPDPDEEPTLIDVPVDQPPAPRPAVRAVERPADPPAFASPADDDGDLTPEPRQQPTARTQQTQPARTTEPRPAQPRPESLPAEQRSPDAAPSTTPAPAREQAPAEEPAAAGAEQPAAEETPAEPKKKPARRGKRASVPSWDEIMFGKKAD